MKVTVIGTGYVGLVVGACLAETGHDVICADIDEQKIGRLKQGEIPIFEPGLEPIVRHNLDEGRLRFTTDVTEATRASAIIFIAVGTPQGEDGSADLQHVLAVADAIGRAMNDEKIVITKSTVPVGTAAKVRKAIAARTDLRFHVCSNPEFLKEGAAVEDFMKPDRVVLGVEDPVAAETLRQLFEPFVRTGHQILIMDVASAEITKYAANAMLATRISFMNAIAQLCATTGADVDKVRAGIGSDARIGPSFLFPGVGYGGSCLAGSETVLVREAGSTRLTRLEDLFAELSASAATPADGGAPEAVWPDDLEVLSWSSEKGAEWRPVLAATRRAFAGDLVEVKTTMGRRVLCTPDHPFVVSGIDGSTQMTLAADLARGDELPIALGAVADGARRSETMAISAALARLGFAAEDVIVRLDSPTAEGLDWSALKAAVAATGDCHTQRIPDLAWDLSPEHQLALLSGLWQGDGSWSLINGGPSVVLEWGSVSRALADGVLRLLGNLGITARLKVGRTAKSTVDTYWLVVSGADQVERLLDLVKTEDRPTVLAWLGKTRRISPTGYRRSDEAAWVRVAAKRSVPFEGFVYSLEVPGTHTFVTSGGLVVHNCFPKDVQALIRTSRELGLDASILEAVERVNHRQKHLLLDWIVERFGEDLSGRTFGVWGLAFKPNTDDMREAPSLVTIAGLLERGARVVAHDPVAIEEAKRRLDPRVEFREPNYAVLEGADALVIHTEWLPYRRPDFARIKELLKQPVIFDGRNLYPREMMKEQGFEYYSVGKRPVHPGRPA